MADVMASHSWGAYDTLALLGGLVIAGALLPGLIRTIKKRDYAGVSYMWQFAYILGLSAVLAYAIHYSLWAILIPQTVELGELLLLTCLKLHHDINSATKENPPLADNKSTGNPEMQLESSKRAGIRTMRYGQKSFDRKPPPEPTVEKALTSPAPDIESAATSGRK